MTNKIALSIGLVLVAFLALDWIFGFGLALFLGRRLLDLISLVAIWR